MALSELHQRLFRAEGECVTPPINPRTGRPFVAPSSFLDPVVGRAPRGYHRHHICDNPRCANPAHIVVMQQSFHKRMHTHGAPHDPRRHRVRREA